jgi:hypothetical protein
MATSPVVAHEVPMPGKNAVAGKMVVEVEGGSSTGAGLN